MRRLCQFVLVAWLLATFAPTVAAHQVALRDGHIIQFEKYRVAEGQLIYVSSDGKEVQVAISSIDIERTRTLSKSDSPPLDLPGLIPQDTPPSTNANQSLGEIARQVRPKDAKVTTQRTFTDDDVTHGSASLPPQLTTPSSTSPDEQYWTEMDQLKKWADNMANQTPRQLSESVAGEIQFPGRADWEQKLYEQKEKLVSVVLTSYSVIKRRVR
jgi:hypothetical protein